MDASVPYRSRFRILRPHTSGGLGEVFVAQDEELQREVALKKIQGSYAAHAESRSRFLREAVITAALEHPGIVPVYGLGEYADGRPFYAMRFIRGESLKDAVDRFHRAPAQEGKSVSRTLELRQLLGRLIAVCNAVGYAHSQGVIHRDLKPDNIMLGNYGETLVVDWGVAKMINRPDSGLGEAQSLPEPPSCTDSELTQIGRTLGTPQFMSPEQAAGLRDRLTPASDIYSLGATLYYLLTGKVPFAGIECDLVPLLVQGGDFPPPRQLDRGIPAPLEAICLKAMSRHPEDRYVSTGALADDLEHWLADEPVHAYPEPRTTRLWRWSHRHRTTVGLAVAALALASTVLIASALLSAAEDRRAAEGHRADRLADFAVEKSRLQDEADQRRLEAEIEWKRAERSESLAKRYLYFSRINLADRAWHDAHIDRMLTILEEEHNTQADLLGFEWHYLWRLQKGSLLTVEKHTRPVASVAYSPDGLWVASAGEDQLIRIWNAVSGERVGTLKGHVGSVNCVAFSPDGKQLASAGDDRLVLLWQVGSLHPGMKQRPVATLRGHADIVNSLAFSRDGRCLASGARDKRILVWDSSKPEVKEGTPPLFILSGHASSINGLAFGGDDRWLASGSGESSDIFRPGEIKIWSLADRREIGALKEHTGTVTSLVLSPDGKQLATASTDRTIKVWDAASFPASGTKKSIHTLRGHNKSVRGIAFSPNGKHLASASEDRTLKIWEVARGLETLTLRGHTQDVTCVAYCPRGERLVSGSDDRTVRVWDEATGPETQTLLGHRQDVNCVAFDPGGKMLASASNDRTIKMWEIETGCLACTLEGDVKGVNSVAFAPDGKWLACGSQDGMIKIWDWQKRLEVKTLQVQGGSVSLVAFSPDGKYLASAHHDGTVRLWANDFQSSVATSAPALTLAGSNPVSALAFSPDALRLAVGWDDGTAKIWDIAGGQTRSLTGRHGPKLMGMCFSPDGQLLATGAGDQAVKLWNVPTGELLRAMRGHVRMVTTVTFSPDGKRLASGSDDQTIKLWDTLTGEEAITLRGHKDTVTSVAFSPDGCRLASASDDWTIQIWNALPLGARGSLRAVAQGSTGSQVPGTRSSLAP